jgi:hypothetical protein
MHVSVAITMPGPDVTNFRGFLYTLDWATLDGISSSTTGLFAANEKAAAWKEGPGYRHEGLF